jgi:hypothetical protein
MAARQATGESHTGRVENLATRLLAPVRRATGGVSFMAAQQIAAPSHRRRTLIAVALLLVALAVGAVTAVRLFPAAATVRPFAGAADETRSLNEFRAGERPGLTQAADDTRSLNEFRAGERPGLTQAANPKKYGPPGR